MKTNFLNILTSFLFALVMSGFLSAASGIPLLYILPVLLSASFLPLPQGVLRDGLNTEVWIDQVRERFYPKNDFLSEVEDMSQFVDYDKINLAAAGVEPNVVINRTVYPIPMSQRQDQALELVLENLSTDSTLVQDAETVELSYNKLESVVRGHRSSLMKQKGNRALFNYAPDDENKPDKTPIIKSSGKDNGNGLKIITPEDILNMEKTWDEADLPEEGRRLIFDSRLWWEFVAQSDELKRQQQYNAEVGTLPYQFVQIGSVIVRKRTNMPRYNDDAGTYTKVAWGGSAADREARCAVGYITTEVMKADGTMKMFDKVDDPDYQGTIVNFFNRFVAVPVREIGQAAIVQAQV